jgi:hypothetical protein
VDGRTSSRGHGTDCDGRQIVRYTIRIELRFANTGEDRAVEYKAVTSLGELKAGVSAALRARADEPEAAFDGVEVVNREADSRSIGSVTYSTIGEGWTSLPQHPNQHRSQRPILLAAVRPMTLGDGRRMFQV